MLAFRRVLLGLFVIFGLAVAGYLAYLPDPEDPASFGDQKPLGSMSAPPPPPPRE